LLKKAALSLFFLYYLYPPARPHILKTHLIVVKIRVDAEVAEWQTRYVQGVVSVRA
jgi:hypothetical protein